MKSFMLCSLYSICKMLCTVLIHVVCIPDPHPWILFFCKLLSGVSLDLGQQDFFLNLGCFEKYIRFVERLGFCFWTSNARCETWYFMILQTWIGIVRNFPVLKGLKFEVFLTSSDLVLCSLKHFTSSFWLVIVNPKMKTLYRKDTKIRYSNFQ